MNRRTVIIVLLVIAVDLAFQVYIDRMNPLWYHDNLLEDFPRREKNAGAIGSRH